MNAFSLYLVLLEAVAMSFSGLASVLIIRENLVVQQRLLTDAQLNDALAISQASPGPLGLYVVVVGYFAQGPSGFIAGLAALVTPALLAVPIAAAVRRGRATDIRGASSGIIIASCMLMLAAGLELAPDALPDRRLVALGAAALALLALTKIKPVWIVLGAACAGLVI